MRVEKVKALEELGDTNGGLEFGLYEIDDEGHVGDYVEWFATEQERSQVIETNYMEVIT